MELFNIENPYYEKWKPGRPSKTAIIKRKNYWVIEKGKYDGKIRCANYPIKLITPKKVKS